LIPVVHQHGRVTVFEEKLGGQLQALDAWQAFNAWFPVLLPVFCILVVFDAFSYIADTCCFCVGKGSWRIDEENGVNAAMCTRGTSIINQERSNRQQGLPFGDSLMGETLIAPPSREERREQQQRRISDPRVAARRGSWSMSLPRSTPEQPGKYRPPRWVGASPLHRVGGEEAEEGRGGNWEAAKTRLQNAVGAGSSRQPTGNGARPLSSSARQRDSAADDSSASDSSFLDGLFAKLGTRQ
ncbi:hypothetical protein CYMTET_52435, partial [Cymbomonas tetramitiformis]